MKMTAILIACLTIAISSPAPAESLREKILRISGISATPSRENAPRAEMEAGGAIWVSDPKAGMQRKVRNDTGFHSPIFAPNDSTIVALRDGWLWRIDVESGKGDRVHHLSEVTKLIGSDRDDPDKILVLRDEKGEAVPALLSLGSGKLTDIPYDAQSNEDRSLINHLKGWERDYGSMAVYPRGQGPEGVVGSVERQDVFFKKDEAEPVNVSRCNGDNCGQPSLSGDGAKVVFVRVAP